VYEKGDIAYPNFLGGSKTMRQPYSSKPEIPVPVRVSFEVEGAAGPVNGWIARLSVAGADIETFHLVPIGSEIALHAALDPESSEVLTFKGRVRWAAGTRMGVQFSELGAKETHTIIQAMRSASPESIIPSSRAGESIIPSSRPPQPISGAPQSIITRTGAAPEDIEIPITLDTEFAVPRRGK
jgi:hypothetical protein